MNRFTFIAVLVLIVVIGLGLLLLGNGHIVMFNPQGVISQSEVGLMELAVGLMLLVVVPVFILTIVIAWHYRASNTKAKYLPDWEHNRVEEFIWWLVPIAIISVLAVVTWKSSHALSPYKPLSSNNPPLTVQVVSLDWKWLFIYPAQGIATVNYLAIPDQTPVTFEMTADAPMNALWIPQLAGQIMTMPGMNTQLRIMANTTGKYRGVSSSFSGDGFAGMQFPVYSMTVANFTAWVASHQSSPQSLDLASYKELAEPSTNNPAAFYRLADSNLYDEVIEQYLATSSMGAMANMPPPQGTTASSTVMQVRSMPMIPAAASGTMQ